MWHGPEWLGFLGAVGSCRAHCGILVCTSGQGKLICSLLCSLGCLGKFHCASRKHHPFKYSTGLEGLLSCTDIFPCAPPPGPCWAIWCAGSIGVHHSFLVGLVVVVSDCPGGPLSFWMMLYVF